MLMQTFFFVTMRPYFRGDETTMYCVKVKAKTIVDDIEMENFAKELANRMKGLHFSVKGC